MNPKLEKYKAEREKNAKRIAALQDRNKVLDEKITQLENSDIIGMVREINLTPDQLAQVLATLKTNPAAAMRGDLGVPGIDPMVGCEDAMAALHSDDSSDDDEGKEAENSDDAAGTETTPEAVSDEAEQDALDMN